MLGDYGQELGAHGLVGDQTEASYQDLGMLQCETSFVEKRARPNGQVSTRTGTNGDQGVAFW